MKNTIAPYGEARFDIGDAIRMMCGMLFLTLASGLIRKGIDSIAPTFSGIMMGIMTIMVSLTIIPIAIFLIFGWLLKRRKSTTPVQSGQKQGN